MQPVTQPSPLAAATCADVRLKVATSRQDRELAFELVYKSYRDAGLCETSPCGLRFTPHQLLDSSDIVVAELHGEVISTMSLIRDGSLGLPMEEVYPEIVSSRRNSGARLAEISCLADRRRSIIRFFELFCELSRVTVQLAAHTGVEELLICVHPRHAPLYRRRLSFEQIGDRRDYPTVCGNPAIALGLNFERAREQRSAGWQTLFRDSLSSQVLVSSPISPADRDYFLALQAAEPLDYANIERRPRAQSSASADESRRCA